MFSTCCRKVKEYLQNWTTGSMLRHVIHLQSWSPLCWSQIILNLWNNELSGNNAGFVREVAEIAVWTQNYKTNSRCKVMLRTVNCYLVMCWDCLSPGSSSLFTFFYFFSLCSACHLLIGLYIKRKHGPKSSTSLYARALISFKEVHPKYIYNWKLGQKKISSFS